MESMKMEVGNVEVGLQYWLRWQVPVCAFIFILPSLVAIRLLKRPNTQPLNSTHVWLPCWTNLNPLYLLFFRAFAFASLAFILYQIALRLRAFTFYFYTQWSFALVMVYFALATIVSARGCWKYSKKPFPGDRKSSEFLKKDSNVSKAKENEGNIKFQSRYGQEEIECKAGFLEHLLQAIYQTCAGASMLTDIVFWCLLYPFLLGENFHVTPLIGCLHSVNAVFLILDSALNSQPFTWYGLAYFVLWSVSYIVFQWTLHACGFTWWPYPFLELSTPWAPLWYLALALVHLPCYGIYVLLIKGKDSIFSKMFPHAFVRSC
ncbi:hypothetical protein U1Q18_034494 [Sarracenia purpurea var. burkii]